MRNALLALGAIIALSSAAVAPTAEACDGAKTAAVDTNAKAADAANLASANFAVDGMSCAVSCPVQIKTALTNLTGVSNVLVNFDEKTINVRYTASEVTPDQMVEAITKLGYKAAAVKEDTEKASS